jgi:hypothetical protein
MTGLNAVFRIFLAAHAVQLKRDRLTLPAAIGLINKL